MKTRIIQTKYWDDPMIIEAPIEARYLYMYYLTCTQIGLTGIFEISDREVQLKTGLSSKQIEKAKTYLKENKKLTFYKSWVKVINAAKYNNYAVGDRNTVAYNREFESIPSEVIENLDSTIGVLSGVADSNHKSETRNQKPEKHIGDEKKFSKISDIGDEEMQVIATNERVSLDFVQGKKTDMTNWYEENPRKNKKANWLATLRNWVRRDALKLKQNPQGSIHKPVFKANPIVSDPLFKSYLEVYYPTDDTETRKKMALETQLSQKYSTFKYSSEWAEARQQIPKFN